MKSAENTFSFENAEDSTGFLLWQVTNLWQREIKKALAPHDITHSQYVLLASIHWLTLGGKPVTQIVLSDHTKIDPMTTSTVLRTLQSKGFVERKEHPTDTRAKTVVLTAAGKDVTMKAVVSVEKFDEEFFKPLKKANKFNKKLLALMHQGTDDDD